MLTYVVARVRTDTTVVLLGFVALGLPIGTFGVAWPAMRSDLDAPFAGLGLLLSGLTIAEAGSSALAGPMLQRVSATRVLAGSALGAAVALGVIAAAPTWPITIAGALLLGAAVGFLDVGVNAYGALTQGVAYLGALHGSWALGAALGPPALGLAIATGGSWRLGFVLIAVFFLLVGATLLRTGVQAMPVVGTTQTGRPPLRPVLLGCAVFFIYVGIEAGAGSWSFVRFTDAGIAGAAAGAAVTAYWSMLALVRIALAVSGNRVRPEALLDAAFGLTAVAGVMVWLLPTGPSAFIALPLLGAAIGTIVPLVVVVMPRRVGRSSTSTVLGLQFASAMLGGATIPAAIGYLMQYGGSAMLGPAVAALCVALGAVHVAARSDDRAQIAT